MRLLIFLQVLMCLIHICQSEDEPNTTIILHDTRTEMTVQKVGELRSKKKELFENLNASESDENNLDFNYEDEEGMLISDSGDTETKEQEMQEVLLKAMRKPAVRKQIGEVIPILRVMSPAQRLTLAALVSSQILSQNAISESNLTEMAAMFAGKNIENADDRHNITEHLLLPISVDIAKMFKDLGKEMGRNLRQNLYTSRDSLPARNNLKHSLPKPEMKTPPVVNRRMDDFDFEVSEEGNFSFAKPIAEALKQPGRDECDFFTKSLCLEVSNYPTEAILSSLKNNQDIAKTFLTDFELQPDEETRQRKRNQNTGRRFERRQDGKEESQEVASEGGYMCPSSVKYARPKRARTTSGQWKYIVNAGDYTQTLRLEICQKAKSPCWYVTNHLNSQCAQVFNYHRLLTWDETKGLHMDVFKVPSCCSCHIHGYSTFFPPNKDYNFAEKRREPSETLEYGSDSPEVVPFSTVGNKREIPKPIPIGSQSSVTIRNQPQYSVNIQEFPKNPVDHLVPPGPPLPLENESIFNSQADKYNQKKGLLEQNKFLIPTEHTRTVNKATERIEINDPLGELPLPTKTRVKPSDSIPQRPSLKNPPIHLLRVPPKEKNPVFDATNQIHYLRRFPNTPPTFPPQEMKIGKPDGGLFVTQKPDRNYLLTVGTKPNPKPPSQYFNPEYNDIKTQPSRISAYFVTPPKEIEVHSSTTLSPPQKSNKLTSSGQRKINYNYHPIIDFFIADSKKRQQQHQQDQDPSPPYPQLSAQEWTPVLGH